MKVGRKGKCALLIAHLAYGNSLIVAVLVLIGAVSLFLCLQGRSCLALLSTFAKPSTCSLC